MRSLILASALVFAGVNVVTMEREEVLRGSTVIVRDGRIETIGSIGEVAIPADARVVYAPGMYVIPGLIDMHAHIIAGDLERYLQYGVTTVRDMAGLPSVMSLAQAVEAGQLAGPRILPATRLIDGPAPGNPAFSVVLPRPEDAQAVVDAELARGARFVKVYDRLTPAAYDAVVAAARARGVPVVGHVPQAVSTLHALEAQQTVEHLSGYDFERAEMFAQAASSARTWNCPTMYVYTAYVTRNMPAAERERYLASRRRMLTALHGAGARIIAGTDAGYLVPAGVALIEELEELHAAGLTRYEALVAATRDAAACLGMTEIGTIAPGARADLVLLDANPFESFDTLRRPAGVAVNGEWRQLAAPRRRAAAAR